MDRLSKIAYYLVDNLCAHMLSRMIDGVQEESEPAAKPVPELGHVGAEICGHGKTLRRRS